MIFISYRRDDAAAEASRLKEALTQAFGTEAVFMDVAHIRLGQNFLNTMDEYVKSSDVLLVIIGRNWLIAADKSGQRRVDNPTDFVRREVSGALQRKIPVVPVLVQKATIPPAEELPENLRELSVRHGTELTHERWDTDVALLVSALRKIPNIAPPDQRAPDTERTRKGCRWPWWTLDAAVP